MTLHSKTHRCAWPQMINAEAFLNTLYLDALDEAKHVTHPNW